MGDEKIRIYAHRGAQNGAPENSFAALNLAVLSGARYIEFDVQLTQDEQLVVIHDEHLYRTAGRAGHVCDMTYTELTQIDIGSYFSRSFSRQTIPGFMPWMQRVLQLGISPNIELKMNCSPLIDEVTYARKLAVLVADYLANCNVPDVRVSSFSLLALQALRMAGFTGEVAFLADYYQAAHVAILHDLSACAYHINYKHIKPKEIAAVTEQGYAVLAYTINDQRHAKTFISAGGCGFFTNNLLLMDAIY